MQDVIAYIQEDMKLRYRKHAMQLLKKWDPSPEDLHTLLCDCIYFTQFQLHKISPDYGAGYCSLAVAMMGCGEEVRRTINLDEEDSPTFRVVISNLGAAIITALSMTGYICVQRTNGLYTSPYEIRALEKWLTLGEAMREHTEREYRNLVFQKPDFIRTHKHPSNRKRVVKRSSPTQFDILLGSEHLVALDKLQRTGWEVNKDVLEAVKTHEWNNVAPEIPKEGNKKLVDILYRQLSNDPTMQESYNEASKQWEKKRKALKERSNIMERMMAETKAMAIALKGVFYNIMEFDYRGRMYYCEPYFHYQGDDVMKGLLQFSVAKPVDERGLYWLKLQAAASYNISFTKEELRTLTWPGLDYVRILDDQGLEDISLDKMALDDRIRWVDLNNSIIIETAKKKILNQKAEHPIIFFATCLEIHRTIQAQKDGTVHYSKLPVAIDGSQNVLQHSSAINRDSGTGKKVGLIQTEVPHDIYVTVGKKIVADLPEFFSCRTMTMKDVRKNISKRSTMVRNYSAGRRSISSNMYRDCVKSGASDDHNITPTDCFTLAGAALKAIDDEVPSNSTFRKYLQKIVAHEIGRHSYTYKDGSNAAGDWGVMFARYNTMNAKARRRFDTIERTLTSGLGEPNITWISPTGFPVIQNICYSASMRVRPSIMGRQLNIQLRYDSKIPELEKHRSAIAANFIHSQDASHAARVINTFNGESFALVHDSFAVHASDVDRLLQITKDEFKKIYDTDSNYYQLIKDELMSDSTGFKPELPEQGDLDFNDLDDSDYFFS